MSDLVQTTSDGLCKLVRWAHSHGTICNLIPSLQHLTCGSYVLTPEPGPHGSSVPVAVWGCGAGHAYHWPLSDHGNGSANKNQGQERFVGGRLSNKVTVRASCDLSYSDAASEGEEFSSRLFDIAGCDSSATDEDGDYEPRPSRKRGGAPGGAAVGKKVKQEAASAEDYDTAANITSMGLAVTATVDVSQACQAPNTHSQITHTLLPNKPLAPCPLTGQDLGCEGLLNPEMEPPGGGSCMAQAERCSSATEATEKMAGEQNELEKLRELLCAERSRNQQMTEIISSLKQDKELLQHELTKKAELICDFLQDKLRPEKRRTHCSNQMEPGSSHMTSTDDVAGFDSSTLFDSFEEMELHPLERHRILKSKRSRDGENTRVRMKNVVGVIARYMAALQEFRRSVSMKVAFDRVGVDRNTISRTAAIAELSLAAPEVFHALAPWDEKEETLAHYAHRCRQAMDDNIKAKIKTMKAKGELLPIVSK
ncbi:coiled-coil domain-containing protein 106 [Chaetodon trifascialis]|uniref:coiled-coil domain-containing protein 106 n=1 Tax=Chaetodon trifascialis TaxID=109706 RepID=UPI003991A2DF